MTQAVEQQTDRRRARGDRSRALILKHAVDMAWDEGLEALTFGRLAAEAGVGKGNLTVLFGDKEALQLATFEAATQRVIDSTIAPAMRKRTPFARFAALCEGWFDWACFRPQARGCIMYATAHEYRLRRGPLHEAAVERLQAWRRLLKRELKVAIAAQEARQDIDVDRAVTALLSFQNMAHLAGTTGDRDTLKQARALSRDYVASLRVG